MTHLKRIFLFVFIFQYAIVDLMSQTSSLQYKLYGFVENQFNFNSRKNLEGSDGLVNLFPLPEKPDANGDDLNEVPSAEMLSINSRLGLDLTGIDVMKAQTSLKIESDFAGTGSTYYLLRIRRAYINMDWEKSALLVGQDWHPLSSALMPSVFGLNGGAPFNPFNRSPQLNYKYKFSSWKLSLAALYQMQYCSDGPAGKKSSYMKNAMLPDLYVGIENKTEHFLVGLGADLKTIVPRSEATVGNSVYKVNESLTSYVGMAYGQYTTGKFTAKAKVVYGQNMTDLLMMGGYGISQINPLTGEQEYTSFNSANLESVPRF